MSCLTYFCRGAKSIDWRIWKISNPIIYMTCHPFYNAHEETIERLIQKKVATCKHNIFHQLFCSAPYQGLKFKFSSWYKDDLQKPQCCSWLADDICSVGDIVWNQRTTFAGGLLLQCTLGRGIMRRCSVEEESQVFKSRGSVTSLPCWQAPGVKLAHGFYNTSQKVRSLSR